LSDSPELLKPNEVTDSELQIELGNLKAENEKLRVDYDALLESSTHVTNELRQEAQELRSQLETERANRAEVETRLADLEQNPATASIDLPEPEHVEFLKRLVAKKDPLISSDLWQEIERLKESNRRLRLKISAERRESIEKISDLEDWVKGLTGRIQEKQARLDELESESELKPKSVTASELPEAANLLNQLKAKRKKSTVTLADVEKILEIIERTSNE
jgi:crotonobetainyl-CoA:carnitine CoA-transferase CaiB-like acyl-CoA transferase